MHIIYLNTYDFISNINLHFKTNKLEHFKIFRLCPHSITFNEAYKSVALSFSHLDIGNTNFVLNGKVQHKYLQVHLLLMEY